MWYRKSNKKNPQPTNCILNLCVNKKKNLKVNKIKNVKIWHFTKPKSRPCLIFSKQNYQWYDGWSLYLNPNLHGLLQLLKLTLTLISTTCYSYLIAPACAGLCYLFRHTYSYCHEYWSDPYKIGVLLLKTCCFWVRRPNLF